MKIVDIIKNNSLLIIPNRIKKNIIKDITMLDGFYNIKYTSFEEIEKKLYSYDGYAIKYLMDKYNYKYNVACVYLDNIRYVEDRKYNNRKLDNLVKLRDELIDNNLISFNILDDYQYDNIIVYGYTYINNYRKNILKKLEDKYNIIYVEDDIKDKDNKIYEFKSIKDEIVYVAEQICSLISDGIKIENIKLIIEDSSYEKLINNIFSMFDLKTSIKNKTSLDVSLMGKFFLDNLESSVEEVLLKIENSFDMNKQNNIDVYNKIINILNRYKDRSNIKELLLYEFRHTYLDSIDYDKEIEVVSIYDNVFKDSDYVFMLGFNQNQIPRINKDEGFLNDREKEIIGLETSYDKNKIEKKSLVNKIKSINNLVISYKLYDSNGTYLMSLLNDELGYEVIKYKDISYKYSNDYNRIKLAMFIDKFVKYGIHEEDLDKLYSSYSNIKYLTYDNTYSGVNKGRLVSFLDNKLLLSYTSLSNYYECGFKYYLTNVLKIVPYEKTYKSLIGDVFHYILSICFNDEFDFDKEYDKYLEEVDFELGEKEKFFFNKLKDDLLFIIDTIKEQYKNCSLNDTLYEKKIEIVSNIDDIEVTFMGIIDKLMYKKINDKEIVAIIDYKTGNPEISLNNVIYGLDMQLPIYLYLAKNSNDFNNPIIVGFYLQRLLNTSILKDYKNNYLDLKKDKLKLSGYSIDNQDLLEEFDNSFNKSKVIKGMSTTSSGEFSHFAKVISRDNINRLVEIVEDNIKKAACDIRDAKFDINPKVIGNENKACKYCMFYDICYVSAKDYVKLEEKKSFMD